MEKEIVVDGFKVRRNRDGRITIIHKEDLIGYEDGITFIPQEDGTVEIKLWDKDIWQIVKTISFPEARMRVSLSALKAAIEMAEEKTVVVEIDLKVQKEVESCKYYFAKCEDDGKSACLVSMGEGRAPECFVKTVQDLRRCQTEGEYREKKSVEEKKHSEG